jgi:hypothetical protein
MEPLSCGGRHASDSNPLRDFGTENRLIGANALRRHKAGKYENATFGGKEVGNANLVKVVLIVEAGSKRIRVKVDRASVTSQIVDDGVIGQHVANIDCPARRLGIGQHSPQEGLSRQLLVQVVDVGEEHEVVL